MKSAGTDVVVVGAGAVGTLTAYRLAGAGLRVTLVDRGAPGRGTSGANFGWASAVGKEPLEYYRLNLASIARFPALAEELGADIEWRPCYSLKVLTQAEQVAPARAHNAQKQRQGYGDRWLDRAEALALVPLLTPRTAGAVLGEGEGTYSPLRLILAVVAAAVRRGVRLLAGEPVLGFERQGRRLTAVRTSRRTIPCGAVVNAAGPQAGAIGQLAGVPIPFGCAKGEMLVSAPYPHRLDPVVDATRQTPAGSYLIGVSWEDDRTDTASTPHNHARIARRACEVLPFLRRAAIVRSFAGVRPVPVDRVAVLGPTARSEGFFWAVTHSGVTLAPVIAEVVTDSVAGRRHPSWCERFSPDRFGDSLEK